MAKESSGIVARPSRLPRAGGTPALRSSSLPETLVIYCNHTLEQLVKLSDDIMSTLRAASRRLAGDLTSQMHLMKQYLATIATPLCVLLLLYLLFLCGCQDKQSRLHEQRQALFKAEDKLYQDYLGADVNHARQALYQMLQLHESDTSAGRAGWAGRLCSANSRLYVLEKRVGNEDDAEANLIKARYWLLRSCEFDGISTKEAIQHIRQSTVEEIFAAVDKEDKLATAGKGPKYLQDIPQK